MIVVAVISGIIVLYTWLNPIGAAIEFASWGIPIEWFGWIKWGSLGVLIAVLQDIYKDLKRR